MKLERSKEWWIEKARVEENVSNKFLAENERLRAEIERLRGALKEILFHNPDTPAGAIAKFVLGEK